ncbi:hypothetical protein [Gluconobacter morbifer]|nr:hypothetical protein [Gluconobacter morbifer]
MNADLEGYLEEGVGRLQDGAGCSFSRCRFQEKICDLSKESRDLASDLWVDQPFLWLSVAFAAGAFLSRYILTGRKTS